MATLPLCPSCNGAGLAKREGEEGNVELHPTLARTLGVCWTCCGSGYLKLTAAQLKEAANKAAAKG